jgi:adenine/guanine/hypoxanthine permease
VTSTSRSVYCLAGAALGFVGLIHAEQVGWNVGGQIALGYAFAGIILLAFWLMTRTGPVAAPDEPAPAMTEGAQA